MVVRTKCLFISCFSNSVKEVYCVDFFHCSVQPWGIKTKFIRDRWCSFMTQRTPSRLRSKRLYSLVIFFLSFNLSCFVWNFKEIRKTRDFLCRIWVCVFVYFEFHILYWRWNDDSRSKTIVLEQTEQSKTEESKVYSSHTIFDSRRMCKIFHNGYV